MPNIFIAIWSYPCSCIRVSVCLCCSWCLRGCRTYAAVGLCRKVPYPHAWVCAQACSHCDRDLFRAPTLWGPAPLLGVSRSSCNLGPTSGKLTWGQLLSLRWLGKFREGCHTGLVGTHPALQHCWLALHLLHAAGHSTLLFGQTGKERQRWHLPHGDILYHCVLPRFLYSVPTIC